MWLIVCDWSWGKFRGKKRKENVDKVVDKFEKKVDKFRENF